MNSSEENICSCLVVGCGHSGTSLMIRLLGQHTQIYSVGEESYVFLGSEPERVEAFLQQTVAACRETGKQMWVEKTPSHIRVLDKIFGRLPQARIVLMLRDPRDTACSLRPRYVDTPDFQEKFKRGLMRWIDDNSKALPWLADPRVEVVRLEKLVAHPQAEMERILHHLNLPYEDVLGYCAKPVNWYAQSVVQERPPDGAGDNHVKLRNWQINQPIFPDTTRYQREMTEADWAIYRSHLEEHGPLFKALGYA